MTTLEISKCYEAFYVNANFDFVQRPALERRRFRVLAIRDPEVEPLSPEEIAMEPHRRRVGRLAHAYDFDRRAERSFYEGVLSEVREIKEPEYGGEPTPPERFAVVEVGTGRVVGRGMHRSQAEGFAQAWSRRHGITVTTIEPIAWPSDADILAETFGSLLDSA